MMSVCLCRWYYTLDWWCLFVCVGDITHLIDDVYLYRRYYTLDRWCLFVSVSNITHLIDDVCLSVQAILHTCSMMSLSVVDITHLIDDVCLWRQYYTLDRWCPFVSVGDITYTPYRMSLAGVSFGFSFLWGHFARYSSFFLFFLFCVHVHFEEMAFYLFFSVSVSLCVSLSQNISIKPW